MIEYSSSYQTYCGPAPVPRDLWLAWNFDSSLILGLGFCVISGIWLLRHATATRQRAFAVASSGAVVAFVSPLCALTVALFAARAGHHLILLSVIAPALAIAIPVLRMPAAASFLTLSAALWAWHIPAIYSAAWDSAAVYWAMQFALLLPAWAFWSVILSGQSWRDIAWLMPLVAQMGFLGAILTFAGRPFYLEHLAVAERFGLTALQDQQLAGLIMWVPGMLPIAAVAGYLAWRQLGSMRQA
ncbi:MAG: cytochrome c oxidase assembly protein [Natronohydrobacter sp.]|nr:cytochrome c oxidase assembly protein [Natronohydrobacter sp.]